MKSGITFIILALLACNDPAKDAAPVTVPDSLHRNTDSAPGKTPQQQVQVPAATRQYANTRFKEVTVQKLNENSFRVKGKGQIFEANFGWVVEDGQKEIKKGYQMTDAGAPEWGRFDFTIEVEKPRSDATLTLTLFETSANDGSRQHELPILLN
jgi:hypothetical protein